MGRSGGQHKLDNSVFLNVYDLTPAQNAYTYWCGVGVFHAGVEVYGVEYAFGGHDYDCSGIFATNPRDPPGQVVFRESIYLGDTDLTQPEVLQLVQNMGSEYKGNRYHLLQRNCNHFATELCTLLVGKPAPAWINRLACMAVSLHCLLPESWVPPLQPPTVDPHANARGGGREDRQALISGPRSDRYLDRTPPDPQTFESTRLENGDSSYERTAGQASTSGSSIKSYNGGGAADWQQQQRQQQRDPDLGGMHKQRRSRLLSAANIKALSYGAMNIVSASGIVFANKAVFQTYGFHFTFALTEVHTAFTLLGMLVLSRLGLFETKALPLGALVQLAAAYVGYIVLCNLSLKVNTVGFYQVMKIAVAPTVIALDVLLFRRFPKPKIVASVLVVCLGIFVATVTDSQMVSNITGMLIGAAATLVTALYQSWAGSKQKELRASSMQLLQAYTPHATLMLGILVPLCEQMGWDPASRTQDTLLGYRYTWPAIAAIFISAALGLLVSLSTFLVIGATSSLTYNVVGHLKTVIILTGGCLFFGDSMPLKKLLGVGIAMLGIVWYTQLKLAQAESSASSSGPEGTTLKPLLPMADSGTGTARAPQYGTQQAQQRFDPKLTAASAFNAAATLSPRRQQQR